MNATNKFTPKLDRPINPLLYWVDSYKISHIKFEIEGVKEIYSNFTPRFGKYMAEMVGNEAWDNKYVVFGVQYAMLTIQDQMQKGFFNRPKDEVISEMKSKLGSYIGWDHFEHFEALHDLGYLPVVVKCLPEGTVAKVGTPFMTLRNTLPEFEWLPNYLETIVSTLTWKPLTVATMGRFFKLRSDEFAIRTTGSTTGVEWQNHDFHVRGASGVESAGINGCAWLLHSCGTDNIPALDIAERFFGSTNDQGLLAGSVSAGEHSVTTLGILTAQRKLGGDLVGAEIDYVNHCLDRFVGGIFSYVSDSFDYFSFLTEVLPAVKDRIMARDGKFVVRGDSGCPIHIIAGYRIKEVADEVTASEVFSMARKDSKEYLSGIEVLHYKGDYLKILPTGFGDLMSISEVEAKGTIEHLWELFGGEINSKGFKVLDSHIGMIYGDGITLKRQKEILSRLEAKGYASLNIVFGVGSYSLNLLGRDHLGMAIKATNAVVDVFGEGEGKLLDAPIYKDPKTDTSKKSARGLIKVDYDEFGVIGFKDQVSRDEEGEGLLRVVYQDGEHFNLETLFDMRDRLWGSVVV